jgi:hypothetical protein
LRILPWCLAFPRDAFIFQVHRTAGLIPADATSSAPAHPLQLYFALAGLLVTSAALLVHPRKAYDGQPALVAPAGVRRTGDRSRGATG